MPDDYAAGTFLADLLYRLNTITVRIPPLRDRPEDIPAQTIVTGVRAVRALAPDTMLLHLQTPRTNRLRFLAGQCVTLGVAGSGGDVHTSYPVAS